MAQIKREELSRCLSAVDMGLSTKDEVEQSSCYVFKGGRLQTFNGKVSCSTKLPAPLREFECAVPSAEFRALLDKLDDEVLDVELKDDVEGAQIVMKMSRRKGRQSRAGIRVQTEVLLPVSEIVPPDEWTKIPGGFAEAIAAVEQCAGDDEGFVLACVHLHPQGIEACDNYQAIRYLLKTGLDAAVLVKRDELKKIATMGMDKWAVAESWVHFLRDSDGLIVSSRRWQERYPKMDEALKVHGRQSRLPKGLVDAVARAEVFVGSKDQTTGVTIDLRPGRLRLLAEGAVGWYEERQEVEYDGEPLSFRIAPRLLREVCRRSDRCVIGEDKLLIRGDRFQYISCLVEDAGSDVE